MDFVPVGWFYLNGAFTCFGHRLLQVFFIPWDPFSLTYSDDYVVAAF